MNGDGILKRKYRWTFQGFNDNGEIVFPESFVKLSERPAFPYMLIANEIISISGSFFIAQFFTMYENSGEARCLFNEFNYKRKMVTSAYLTSYDGCGNVMEKWNFNGIIMSLSPESELDNDDGIIAEWLVNYKTSNLIGNLETV